MKIPLTFGPPHVAVERRADGAMIVTSPEPLQAYPRSMTDWLDHWALAAPDRVFLAERVDGVWRKVTYAEARDLARRIARAIIDRDLSPERPIAILSGNSVDHALIGLGAMIAGVPYAPVSQPYSLVAKDYGKLKAILDVLTPGLVYVSDGARFTLALAAGVPKDAEVVAGVNPPAEWPSTTFEAFIRKPAGPEVDAAHARVGPDTVAKLLFTSGSTGSPKGVINTQKMMTSNQAMLKGVNPSYHHVAPVLVDWLPWSHTFGGNNNFNLVLSAGGSYYIDEGRPLTSAIEATVRNLKDVSPTIYYNVPKGFEMLLPYVEQDADLRRSLFAHLQAFVYAGAALSPYVREAFERLGRETVGHVVPILTSLGSTETGPSALSVTQKACAPGVVGIPNHGVEMKLIPNGDKLEARLKSPSITPGYWRRPDLTKDAFDEEGYYKLGDALKFFDESDPELGFVFDGRVAEDFKLGTGVWVSVGPLRTPVHRPLRALRNRPCRRRPRPRRRGGAGRALRSRLPRAFGARRARERRRRPHAFQRAREVFHLARRLQPGCRRQLAAHRAPHSDGRSALARHRRAHRQGLDQPARRAGAARRHGRRALRRNAFVAHDPLIPERRPKMKVADLVAIDVHTHAEVSCRQPADAFWQPYEDAANIYFKAGKRPTIAETVAYYRERKIGLVMFTVDSEFEIGNHRIPNDEVAEAAAANADMMIAFASIDPHKGKLGVREARELIEAGVVKGFKFHPTVQGFFPNDRIAYGLYELIAHYKLPAVFHSGHSGIGTGMPGGGGMRLKYSNPIHLDDVAVDFPDMTIIIAHPSWPWQDEALSVCLHKPNVYIDLSGWSPKYFPPQLVQYANGQLKTKMLFGSDFPLIPPDRWIKDFKRGRLQARGPRPDPQGERHPRAEDRRGVG